MMKFVRLLDFETDLTMQTLYKYARSHASGSAVFFVRDDGTPAIVKKANESRNSEWLIEKGARIKAARIGSPGKLTMRDKKRIKQLSDDKLSCSVIADIYGIDKSTVSLIVRGLR